MVGCACFQNGLPCTELCTCAADIDKCGNAITSEFKHDYNEEEEEEKYKNKETVCAK